MYFNDLKSFEIFNVKMLLGFCGEGSELSGSINDSKIIQLRVFVFCGRTSSRAIVSGKILHKTESHNSYVLLYLKSLRRTEI
jgi:hypothetical protein